MQASARGYVAADRLTFMFQEPSLGVCVRLVGIPGGAPAYSVKMSAPWQPASVSVFNTTDSCLQVSATPPAPELAATAASGSAFLETYGVTNQFCRLQVMLEVEAADADWLTMPFTVSSPDTPVEGACP